MSQVRVALYARCSTNEEKQEVENQLLKLRESAGARGWQVSGEYVDYVSGRKGRDRRPEFDRLMKEASQGKFDLVYFWRLDRFSREGIDKTIHYLKLLDGWGVKFKSYNEEYLDTENELVAHILLGVLSYFAKQQAIQISENTKAGLERAKKQGKRLGRPPLPETTKRQIIDTWKQTGSQRQTGKLLNIPRGTVQKVVSEHQATGE